MCLGHRQRWIRPAVRTWPAFTASTSPRVVGHLPLRPARSRAATTGRPGADCAPAPPALVPAGRPDISSWRLALDGAPPVTAAGHLPGPVLRACGPIRDLGVLPHPSQALAAGRPGRGRASSPPPRRSRSRAGVYRRARLPGQLRLEMQYVLQCRGDERRRRCVPARVQQILRDLAATGAASLLDWPEEQWAEPRAARHQAPAAAASSSWTPVPASSIWPSAAAGMWSTPVTCGGCGTWASRPRDSHDRLRADHPAMADRPGQALVPVAAVSGLSASDAAHGIRGDPAVLRLPRRPRAVAGDPAYRPRRAGTLPGRPAPPVRPGSRRGTSAALNGFFRAIRRHGWDDARCPPARSSTPRTTPSRPAAAPGARRARHGPGREPRPTWTGGTTRPTG